MEMYYPEGTLYATLENQKALGDRAFLEKAYQDGKILEAKALLCDREQNLVFDLGGIRGEMKREEAALTPNEGEVRSIAVITRVGKPCAFVICGFEEREGKTVALLSRKKAQEKCLAEYLDLLETGDILEARVTHLEPFGAFCDIGCGIISLLSIDCISVSRISHPRDRFSPGDHIFVAVKGRDEVLFGTKGRIALTHRELLGTWQENADLFSVGQTVVGIVRSVEPYGVFVELTPNLAGLSEHRDDVQPGDACSVYIKNIIPSRMKVKLVIIEPFRGEKAFIRTKYFIRSGNIRSFCYAPPECERADKKDACLF